MRDPLVELTDEAAAAATDWLSVGAELSKRGEGSPERDAVEIAFKYELLAGPVMDDRREQWGPFAPMISAGDKVYPPLVSEIDQDTVSVWTRVAKGAEQPAAISRLSDLLWERGVDEKHLHAQRAIDAYVEIGDLDGWSSVDQQFALVRAVELASRLNDGARLTRAIEQLVALVTRLIDSSESPGPVVRGLEVIADLKGDQRPDNLDELIASAYEAYADPFIRDELIVIRGAMASSPEAREVAERDRVQLWLDYAAEESGFQEANTLEKAARLADQYGLIKERDQALSARQKAGSGMEMAAIESETTVETERIERFINAVVGDDGWTGALVRFAGGGPPSGDVADNATAVVEETRAAPVLNLFPTQVLDDQDNLLFTADTDEKKARFSLAQKEQLRIKVWAAAGAVEALRRATQKYGVPDQSELEEFFSNTFISPRVAERMARAVVLVAEQAFDEASHILAPRLETAIRAMAREVGVPVIKLPRGDGIGGAVGLGGVLANLHGVLDESYRRYFYNALVEPAGGLNLRNEIGHELKADLVSEEDAAVLVHIAGVLRGIKVGKREGS